MLTARRGTNLTLNNVQYTAAQQGHGFRDRQQCRRLRYEQRDADRYRAAGHHPATATSGQCGGTASFVSGATGVPVPGLQWYKKTWWRRALVRPSPVKPAIRFPFANAQDSDIAILLRWSPAILPVSVTSSVVKLTVNSTALASTMVATRQRGDRYLL